MKKLPDSYIERMKALLGSEYSLYEESLDEPPARAFRVNTDKISLSDFEKINDISNEKIPYVENGYYFNTEKIGSHPFHHAGMIYVQEPAAMAPAECLSIKSDWKILDMCAAPGGKSTQLKNKLGERGVLVSNEIIPSRCKILTGNIERLGLKNTVTTCMDTDRLADVFGSVFDMVMADVPCSGEGMFRKDSNAIAEWSTENVEKCAERQKHILKNAVRLLKNSGYIVYSTCTFSLEENEMVIDWFLRTHPDFEIVPLSEKVQNVTERGILFDGCKTADIHYAGRFYPHKAKGEGQFMAVLHNKCENAVSQIKLPERNSTPVTDSGIHNFLRDTLESYKEDNVILYNGNPVYFTPDFEIKKGTAFSCGVTIGEIKKNYILPHHQFFTSLGKSFKRRIELPPYSDELKRYLHGEEISADCENGWAVVTVCDCPVGGAKAVSGRAKNHYPKGLRSLL